jgi:hypothetical protein
MIDLHICWQFAVAVGPRSTPYVKKGFDPAQPRELGLCLEFDHDAINEPPTPAATMDYLRTLGSAAVSSLVQKSGLNLPFTLGTKVTSFDTVWNLYDATKRVRVSAVNEIRRGIFLRFASGRRILRLCL